MDWTQVLTFIASVAGGYYMIHRDLKSDMNKMDEKFVRMESFHRADMVRMDEKWERLFERLLLQDKKS